MPGHHHALQAGDSTTMAGGTSLRRRPHNSQQPQITLESLHIQMYRCEPWPNNETPRTTDHKETSSSCTRKPSAGHVNAQTVMYQPSSRLNNSAEFGDRRCVCACGCVTCEAVGSQSPQSILRVRAARCRAVPHDANFHLCNTDAIYHYCWSCA